MEIAVMVTCADNTQRLATIVLRTPPWGDPPLLIKGAFHRIPPDMHDCVPDPDIPFALELHPPDGYAYQGVMTDGVSFVLQKLNRKRP